MHEDEIFEYQIVWMDSIVPNFFALSQPIRESLLLHFGKTCELFLKPFPLALYGQSSQRIPTDLYFQNIDTRFFLT